MSESYESIPLERQVAYLQNAEEAMHQAAEPVLRQLGGEAIRDAEQITADYTTQRDGVVQEASQYVQDNDLSEHFMDEMEKPRESGIAEQAERYLGVQNGYWEAGKNRANLKHFDFKDFELLDPSQQDVVASQMDQWIDISDDKEIRNLTVDKKQSPQDPPENI